MADSDIGIVIGGDASQLTAELQRSGGAVQQFGQSATNSLNGLASVVNGLSGATQSMAQHFAQLNAAAGRDAFSSMAQGLGASQAAIAANNAAMEQANARLVGMRGGMDALGASAKGAGSDMHALSLIGSQLGAALTLNFAVNKMLEFRSAIQDAQITMDKLRNTITYGMGAGAVGQELDYLRKQTNAMGLEFSSASMQYTKFAAAARGTAMEGQGVKDVFESIGKAGTVMGLSAADMQGVFLALTQVMSKGTVQAEEIRGQLGERLPGAFQIASRAMGVTTGEFGKLLETGQVLSSDFLPKFAAQMEKEFAGSFDAASHSAQASMNRLTSSWELLKMALADDAGIGKGIASLNDRLSAMLSTWTTNIRAMAQSNGMQQFFMAAIYDSKGLAQELDIAQAEFAKLSAQHEKAPNNIYINSMRADAAKYILALIEAKKRQDDLSGSGKQGPGEEAAAKGISASKVEDERVAKLRAQVAAIETDLSGQSPNFQKHIGQLQDAFSSGIISQAQYVKDVQDLVKKEGGIRQAGADHIKSIHDARFALQKAAEEQTTASMSLQLAQQQRINDLAYKGGSIDLESFYARKAALETEAIDRREKMLKQELEDAQRAAVGLKKDEDKLRAQERIVKITTQLIELGKERIKVDGPDDQALRGWQKLQSITEAYDKQVASINLQLYTQQKTLGEANQEARLKLEYQFDTQGALKEELALIDIKTERQRKILELKLAESSLTEQEKNNLRSLLDENAALLAQQAKNNAVSAMLSSIEQTARSVWTNVTQGGQDAFKRIGQTLKAAVLDLLYQLTIKKWIISIGASVTGGVASASGTDSGTGSLMSAGKAVVNNSSWFTDFGGSSGNSINQAGGWLYNKGFEESGAYLIDNAHMLGEAMSTAGTYLSYATALYSASQGKWGAAAGTAIGSIWGPVGAAIGNFIGGWVDKLAGNTGARPSVEGGYASAGTQGSANGRAYVNQVYGGQIDLAAQAVVDSVTSTYQTAVKALGGKAGVLTAQSFIGLNQGDNGNPNKLGLDAQLNGQWLYNRWTDQGGTNDAGKTDAEMSAAVSLSTKKIVIEALKATDLGKALNDYLDTVVTQGKTLEEITATMDNLQGFVAFRDSVKSLPFDYLTNASVAAAHALIVSAGSFENFQSSLSNYVDKFYTDAEKTGFATKALTSGFESLGVTMPAVGADTREWYKSLVASLGAQDLSIEANARAYASVLALAGGVDSLAASFDATQAARQTWQDKLDVLEGKTTERQLSQQRDLASTTDAGTQALIRRVYAEEDAIQAANAAASAAAASAAAAAAAAATKQSWQDRVAVLRGDATERQLSLQRDLASTTDKTTQAFIRMVYGLQDMQAAAKAVDEAYKSALTGAKAAVDRAAAAERTRLTAAVDVRTAQVTSMQSVFDTLKTNVKSLYGQVASTAAQSAQQGQSYIATALALAKAGGVMPDQAALADAIAAARGGVDSTQYASQFEADRARLVLAGQLSQLQTQAGAQLSTAEQALRLEKSQLTALEQDVKLAQALVDKAAGIDTSITSMASALAALNAVISTGNEYARTTASNTYGLDKIARIKDAVKSMSWGTSASDAASAQTLGAMAKALGWTSSDIAQAIGASLDQVLAGWMRYGVSGVSSGTMPVAAAASTAAAPAAVAPAAASTRGATFGGTPTYVPPPDTGAYIMALDWGTAQGTANSVAQTYAAAQQYGWSQAQIASSIGVPEDVVRANFAAYGIPKFAAGGDHMGGWRVVGENGPEVEATGPARIFNATQTANMLRGSDNVELLNEVRLLGVRLAAIEKSTSAMAVSTGRVADAHDGQSMTPLRVEVVNG